MFWNFVMKTESKKIQEYFETLHSYYYGELRKINEVICIEMISDCNRFSNALLGLNRKR